ncbi:TetR family transcriptional regulator [Actinophytocola sp. S1-96]|uniref:TetR family transcriptional regulator n=2 Tax=Actinophytocola gossypii TaxID=2812003 RepID=A0ABT2J645_9PSEU|nr:TetR family transcriptional regulator [Actinophytocola gossypii]
MRKRLLDATVDCLVRYGYTGTTTTRVTELAGVTRGAQVHHFPTRADLVAATVRHLAALRVSLASDRVHAVRQAPDPLEAALDLLWEIHDGPVMWATMELWVAARTDPGLREQLVEAEPAARAALLELAGTAFGAHADEPRLRHVMDTALDTARGVRLLGLADPDPAELTARWKRAKADLRLLVAAVAAQVPDRINGAR